MTALNALNGWERLDPALRAVATTRTNFSLSAIKLMGDPLNDRRRGAADRPAARGWQSAEHPAQAEAASVPVRVYRGGHTEPTPVVGFCPAGGFAVGTLAPHHRPG